MWFKLKLSWVLVFSFVLVVCNQQSFADSTKQSANSDKDTDINKIDKQLNNCLEKHFSTAEMIDCCETAYRAWDKELNHTYTKLMNTLPARAKTLLKVSQLEWIKYRDRDFELNDEVYAHASGSMYRPLRVQHRIDVVKARVFLLKDLDDVPNDS